MLIASKAREADLKKMSYGGANESTAVEEGKGREERVVPKTYFIINHSTSG